MREFRSVCGEEPVSMTLCAGILAGGQSSRFGSDKALALLHGKPLLQHLIDSLRPQVDGMLLSVRSAAAAAYRQFGVPLVGDSEAVGPLGGAAALLAANAHEWLLLVPCDALALPRDWAASLLATALQQRVQLVVCHDGERLHPTFALLHRSLTPSLQQALVNGERALYRWQASVSARAIFAMPAPVNINTVEDLRRISDPNHHADGW